MLRFNKEALFEPNFHPNFNTFKEELDDLIVTLRRQPIVQHGGFVEIVSLLPVYLASKYVYNSITFLKCILEEVIIDPTNLSYNEYAEKFEELAESFFRQIKYYENCNTEDYPPDESDMEKFDSYRLEFGETEEELFGPIEPEIWNPEKKGRWVLMVGDVEVGSSDRVRRPDTTIYPNDEYGNLSTTINVIFKNDVYLTTAIWTCLEDLAKLLREIQELLYNRTQDSQIQEELFLKRRNDYLESGHWSDAREELYNDIRLLSGVVDELQVFSNIKVQVYYRLKNNFLGQDYLLTNCSKFFIRFLFSPHYNISQAVFNEFLKLNCQYKHICKLVDFHSKWNLKDDNSLFINKGVELVVNKLLTYIAGKIDFKSRKSYAALWQALIDLNLLSKMDAESFKDWVNNGLLKDAPDDSSRGGKIKTDKSIREAVDDMYKFQTKEGKQKQFKDLTEEEISQLKNGNNLKELYRDCILILSKAYDINLKEENFQSYISEYPNAKEYLSDFPADKKSRYILECFRAYEDFLKH